MCLVPPATPSSPGSRPVMVGWGRGSVSHVCNSLWHSIVVRSLLGCMSSISSSPWQFVAFVDTLVKLLATLDGYVSALHLLTGPSPVPVDGCDYRFITECDVTLIELFCEFPVAPTCNLPSSLGTPSLCPFFSCGSAVFSPNLRGCHHCFSIGSSCRSFDFEWLFLLERQISCLVGAILYDAVAGEDLSGKVWRVSVV